MGKETISKIEKILGKIRLHPDYSSHVADKTIERIRHETDRHSSDIETNPDEYVTTKDLEKARCESYKRLVKARTFLKTKGVDNYTISCLGNLLEPETNPYQQFRTRSVNFGSFEGTTPSSIYENIDDLIWRMEDVSLHPIRRAEDAHISLVDTHPFFDGNGRAARLLQDICLEGHAYPSGIIPLEERGVYIQLMNKTIQDRRNGLSCVYSPSSSEKNLYDFIDNKILTSSLKLESSLQKNSLYHIWFKDNSDKPLLIATKKALTSLVRRRGASAQVRLDKRGRYVSAKGDLSEEEIATTLKGLSKLSSYCISDKTME